MRIIFTILFLSLFTISCVDSKDKAIKSKMGISFNKYIKDNDTRKDLVTKLKFVKVVSYEEIDKESEKYEAMIYMRGTSGYAYSAKIYNIDDTVACYFDKDLNMLRLVNPYDEQ